MAKIIDKSGTLETNPTYGLLINEGAPTTPAMKSDSPAPFEQVKDRPVDPVKDVYGGGGAVMINDTVYQNGAYSPNKITSGSDNVRKSFDSMVSDATSLDGTLGTTRADMTIEDLKKALGYAPASQSEIQAAEDAAAARETAKWDPLIQEAKTQKEKGFAKATISVGERGGFMSSQMAGAAALVPTVGQDFSGAGGKLNEIESDYDNNISSLKAKSLEAISAAKEQARAAIEKRDSEAYKRAIELFKLAQDANAQTVELAQKKVDLVSSYKKLEQARVDYDTSKIDQIAKVGGVVPDEMKTELDSLYGEGWSDLYIETSKDQAAAESEEAQVKKMQNITDLLKSWPAGKQIPIGNDVYETIGSSSDTQTFKEMDGNGNATMITIDKRTGIPINTAVIKNVGKKSSSGGGGSSSSKESYFTRPVDGKTQYFYGNKNDYQNAQVLSPEEYRKGVSSAANTMPEGDYSYGDARSKLQDYFDMGYDKQSAKLELYDKLGSFPAGTDQALDDIWGADTTASEGIRDWLAGIGSNK